MIADAADRIEAERRVPDDIMAAVLLSSDVGKLYMLMAKALGRLN